VREHRVRAESRAKSRELDALRREVQKLRGEAVGAKDGDDVLAILENTG
jgi:hypothetical protein